MVDLGRRAARILMVAALGLLIGCGGGGDGNGGCPASPVGNFSVAVDITAGCASNVLGVWSGDIEFPTATTVRIRLYVPETTGCCPETLILDGVETAPNSFTMDDLPDRFVCALNEVYGYESFGVLNATLDWAPLGWLLTGQASVIAGAACLGTITLDGTPP